MPLAASRAQKKELCQVLPKSVPSATQALPKELPKCYRKRFNCYPSATGVLPRCYPKVLPKSYPKCYRTPVNCNPNCDRNATQVLPNCYPQVLPKCYPLSATPKCHP